MTRETELALFVIAFLSFLAGIGADAAATKIAAWRALTRQRREALKRASDTRIAGVMDLIANGKHYPKSLAGGLIGKLRINLDQSLRVKIGQVPEVTWADSSGRELPMAALPPTPPQFVIDIPTGTPWSLVIAIMRQTMQELKGEDRHRYFPGDHTAKVN